MLLVSSYSPRPFAQCHLGQVAPRKYKVQNGWIEADFFFVGIGYANFQSAIKLFRASDTSESQYQRFETYLHLNKCALKGLAL